MGDYNKPEMFWNQFFSVGHSAKTVNKKKKIKKTNKPHTNKTNSSKSDPKLIFISLAVHKWFALASICSVNEQFPANIPSSGGKKPF